MVKTHQRRRFRPVLGGHRAGAGRGIIGGVIIFQLKIDPDHIVLGHRLAAGGAVVMGIEPLLQAFA